MSVSVEENLKHIKERMAAACARAGRDLKEVTLVAVSKTKPVSMMMEAYGTGIRDFGENKVQELLEKKPQMPEDTRLHLIGHLQTNKLKLVLPYVSMVESVDSLHLLEAIDRWGRDNGRITDILLEMHIASETTKQGFSKEELMSAVSLAASCPNVRISGLMGMATFTDDEDVIRKDFAKLVAARDEIRAGAGLYPGLPVDFGVLSFGMTHDYRIAVGMGADIVRIGTLIFGERTY